MFDLEPSLRQWRRETEATLAFSSDELDELEDHLRLSFAAKIKDGLAPEIAWNTSLEGLGPASALALEFAKGKLLPALGRLLYAWWQPAILCVLFASMFSIILYEGQAARFMSLADGLTFWPEGPHGLFGGLTAVTFLAILIFLPDRTERNALLLGLGNAFCLIPLLHILFYNTWTEQFVGFHWCSMAADFGWKTILVVGLGLMLINAWYWKRCRPVPEKLPRALAVASVLVLLFAVAPFCSELIGNLSLRDFYQLPAVHDLPPAGPTRDKLVQWIFVRVLFDTVVPITTWLPFILCAILSVGILSLQLGLRRLKTDARSEHEAFPSRCDKPWIMTLAASGGSWILAHFAEPGFGQSLDDLKKDNPLLGSTYGGLEIMVLCSAILFFICGYEVTRRLRRSTRLQPFYASLIVMGEGAVFTGLFALPLALDATRNAGVPSHLLHSAQPAWLSWLMGVVLVAMMLGQAWLIRQKVHAGLGVPSLWKFEGKDLVASGLTLGLHVACAGLVFIMVAVIMAYTSVIGISAMIDWGHSIAKPLTVPFDPQKYVTRDHLFFWLTTSFVYVSFCCALAMGTVMALSGLEFIRFNCYRLFKLRKIRQAVSANLTVEDKPEVSIS